MTSPSITSPIAEEGTDQDGAEHEGGAAELPHPKLRLAMFNGSVFYGTHNKEMVGRGKRNRKMA